MKKDIWFWQLLGLTFTAVFGTLFHFLYSWTKFLPFALFCAVNESTFEHVKILFFPMLLFAVFQFFFFRKDFFNFWRIKLSGILLGTALIPVLFYTYAGAFGAPPDWLNISFFFISAGAAYFVEGILFKRDEDCPHLFNERKHKNFNALSVCVLLIFAATFILFTFYPPRLPIFKDPINGGYGVL